MVLFRKNTAPLPDLEAIPTVYNTNFSIQPNDALSITVSCIEPSLATPFNLGDGRTSGNLPADSPLISYLVDNDGNIEFPVLGKIKVAKLTVPQLRDTLAKKIKPYVKDPSINIRRVNFRVTVVGEVAKPGSYIINNERITVLEALGLAGDLTPHSDRQRVLVMRESNGKTLFGKLDLQSPDFFRSPYYYLQQNDVIYVDPRKTKKGEVNDQANKVVNWTTAAFSAITATLTVIFLFGK
jgi:polysaccharide export outer membrane protein